MEEHFMKEVDQEIHRILNKDKQKFQQNSEFCNKDNLEKCLKDISQEFDYLDVSCMEESFSLNSKTGLKNILIQLLNSSNNLITLYRDTQKRQNESTDKHSKLFDDVKTLMKTVDSLRKEVSVRERELKILKEKSSLNSLENTELKSKINDAKKEVISYKQNIISEKNRHKHEINKIMHESKMLQDIFKKNSAQYISQEGHIINVIDSYKKNQEKHLKMIQTLQENNHILLEEIVNLKGELAEASFKHRV